MRSFIPLSEETSESTPSHQDMESLSQNALYAFSLLQLTPRRDSSCSRHVSTTSTSSNGTNVSPKPPVSLSPPLHVEPEPPATPSQKGMSASGSKNTPIPLKRFISASEGKRKASTELHNVTHKRRRTEDRLEFHFFKGKGKARELNIWTQGSSMSSASSPEDSESSPRHSTPEYPISPLSYTPKKPSNPSKPTSSFTSFRGAPLNINQSSSSSQGTRARKQDKSREISESMEVIDLSDSSAPSMEYIELSD
ncbi:1589_t:CDS:2 [Acaulospora colombiana]|uniref:1589_t:CDS:1 n=1 Tax=Acaulospora colombiana TaxID=27376 RepID=A0ACA9LN38_9GLOM|nr:1589_t:CDS:2 [Acaulospora colombiana]